MKNWGWDSESLHTLVDRYHPSTSNRSDTQHQRCWPPSLSCALDTLATHAHQTSQVGQVQCSSLYSSSFCILHTKGSDSNVDWKAKPKACSYTTGTLPLSISALLPLDGSARWRLEWRPPRESGQTLLGCQSKRWQCSSLPPCRGPWSHPIV